jgi:pyridine nucleotide-disulfide oxidoreductase family protein
MKRLLLIGAGHAHAQVVKEWIGSPVPGCELVLVSPSALAPYSGMVPGWLAGTYRFEEICIDFAALLAAAGGRVVIGEVASLDLDRRQVQLHSGSVLDYDVLSLNIGSTLTPPPATQRMKVLSLRPLGELRRAWDDLLTEDRLGTADDPLDVTAIGGGAGGVEALLAVLARLREQHLQRAVRGALITRSTRLLPGFAPAAVRSAEAALARAGVSVQLGSAYGPSVEPSTDLLLWATGAEAHAWPRESGLAVSERGFIRVDERLRSVSHAEVYAVGDCAQWAPPLPKAGVYAVRMGPVLSGNLRAALGVGTDTIYAPQRVFLALLATADGSAIASWGRWSAQGRWAWRWKDHIDRSFIARYVVDRRPVANT